MTFARCSCIPRAGGPLRRSPKQQRRRERPINCARHGGQQTEDSHTYVRFPGTPEMEGRDASTEHEAKDRRFDLGGGEGDGTSSPVPRRKPDAFTLLHGRDSKASA